MANTEFQRLPAEELYQTELDALIAAEQDPVPAGWRMSPRSVLTYITGGTAKGVAITPEIYGQPPPGGNCDCNACHRPRLAADR